MPSAPRFIRLFRAVYNLTPRGIARNRAWLFPLLLGVVLFAVSFPLDAWAKVVLFAVFVCMSIWMSALDAAWKDAQNRSRQDIAGALGFIAERVDRRLNNKSNLRRDAFVAELRNQQIRLLELARRAICEESGVPLEGLWANWCIQAEPADGTERFRVEFFHGDTLGRTPGRSHPISEELPGASKAFTTTQVALVGDTHHPTVAGHFDQNEVYRCILSVPVRVAADGNQWVIGVANFDSAVPNSFSVGMHRAVADFVYLIGLCEGLKRCT